jgi:hypothetical protein
LTETNEEQLEDLPSKCEHEDEREEEELETIVQQDVSNVM